MRVNADAMTLYAVTDRTWVEDTTLMDQVKEALEGGITFLQLREKHLSKEEFIKEAREMKELSKEYKVPFVINDNIEVALAVDADGVHIGQDDMSVEEARKLLGEDKIIGVSAHNVEEAIKAVVRGKNIKEQSEVDEMAKAIEDAIAALEKNPAQAGSKTDQNTKDDAKANTEPTTKANSSGTPKTGDHENAGLMLAILYLSGTVIAGLIVSGKKKKYRA